MAVSDSKLSWPASGPSPAAKSSASAASSVRGAMKSAAICAFETLHSLQLQLGDFWARVLRSRELALMAPTARMSSVTGKNDTIATKIFWTIPDKKNASQILLSQRYVDNGWKIQLVFSTVER